MPSGSAPVATLVDASDRRRYLRACAIGALPAVVLFTAVLAMNGIGFHGDEYTTNFHTEQMRSLLHLHWDISPSVLSIEGFGHNGKWFSYYGLFPGLFRLPFMAISTELANRITQKSMLWPVAGVVVVPAAGA